MLPLILPPLVGVLGFVFIFGRAGTVNILLMDWFGMETADQLHVRHAWRAAGRDGAPVSDDHAERARRALQGRPDAGGSRRGHGGQRLAQVLGYHAAADDAGLRVRSAARLHLDLRRLHHAARARRAGPAGTPGLSQHCPVRRPAHLPHGDRDLGAARHPCHPVRAGRPPIRGGEGLQLACLYEDSNAASSAP